MAAAEAVSDVAVSCLSVDAEVDANREAVGLADDFIIATFCAAVPAALTFENKALLTRSVPFEATELLARRVAMHIC